MLFLVYVNDISNASDKLDYVLFADDTNILMTDKTLYQLYTKVNNELEKISGWVLAYYLTINIKKTTFTLCQSRSVLNNLGPVYLSGFELQRVTSNKFLGVNID